jgi:hypothetical protein
MVELGKIEKPEAEGFKKKKKLYCVRNLYLAEDAPDEYKTLFNTYWNEVSQHIEKMETAGKILKIFCENISVSGKEALDILGKMNERALQLIKKKLEEGGTLFPLEHDEIFGPFLDWGNCLMVVRTRDVFDRVYEFYTTLLNKRFEHILETIEKNLSAGEAGLLLMRDEDRAKIQFPPDIEVFLVTPPSYDNILKWLREQLKTHREKKETAEPKQET